MCQQVVEGRTQRIDVRIGVRASTVLLRRRVPRGIPPCRASGLVCHPANLGDAKVHQFDRLAIGQQADVSRLDVAVDDRAWVIDVQVGHGIQHLVYPDQNLVLGQWSRLLQQLAQILSLDVLHDQVLVSRRLDKVVRHPRQDRMVEVGQYSRFHVELLLCAGRRIRAILDGTELLHHQVLGEVDITKAALT